MYISTILSFDCVKVGVCVGVCVHVPLELKLLDLEPKRWAPLLSSAFCSQPPAGADGTISN